MATRRGNFKRAVEGLKNIIDRESRKKAAKESAMEAEKEAKKFMDTVQTIKSKQMTEREGSFAKGGRAGYKMGSKCKIATKGKGRAYGKNS